MTSSIINLDQNQNNQNNQKAVILSVDDDPTNLLIIEQCFLDNHIIISTSSGKDALEKLSKKENMQIPDLVLLDIMLPEMDGFEIIKKIREINSEIPVIFITALTSPEDICKGLTAGAQDYITKPFNIQELRSRVNTHLNAGRYLKLVQEISHLEAVQAMITSLAHEINNPLTIALSNLDFIDCVDEEQNSIKSTINNNLLRIATVIKKIEHLKKIEFTSYFGNKKMIKLGTEV
ncbi:MAG: response regulator [Oligoflexia bacterium]|nr:response regulator [Oligoflexia bacterium]